MTLTKQTRGLVLAGLFCSSLANAAIISDFDETKIQAPLKNSNEESLQTTVCKTRNHLRWDVCYTRFENDEEQMRSFKFSNTGENKIVPKSGFGLGRDFEFMFQDLARSDMGLLLWDMPDEYESHGHLKLMMFFPRKVMPAIRYFSDSNKDIVTVTLPTMEEVVFNGKTKEVVSGVLSEAPMKQDKDGVSLSPGITYTGSGVVMEADRVNDYPVGLAGQSKNNFATIRKNGFKECKVSVKDLWYTDDSKGGNVFFNKKYVSDEAFDKFLKQKCKFSMY